MALERGMALLTDTYSDGRIPVMEHPSGLSREAIRHFSGIDPLAHPERLNEAFRKVAEAFEIDLLWGGGLPADNAEVFDWADGNSTKTTEAGRPIVQWGIFATGLQEDGRHFLHVPKPASVDEALAIDPLEYFPKTVEEYVAEFTAQYTGALSTVGECAYPIPHHYTTLFHWALGLFGFETLCEVGMEEDRFDALMERFAEVSRRITTAWSRVPGVRGFILHDDLTTARGPIFRPAWYRRHILPRYPAIFEPLKAAGIPIIFTSDGNCTEFVDDILAAGADGLNFEYLMDLERLVTDYPDKILIGNLNSRVISGEPISRIEEETRRCLEIGSRARRFVMNVGGGLTHDMSVENLEAYLRVRKSICRTL